MLNLTSVTNINGRTYDFAIKQGKTYEFSFKYGSNLTIGVIRGQIRDRYAQEGGELLGEFSFSVSWNEEESKSLVVVRLSATQTSVISYTRYQGVGEATVRNCYVYDIEYEENGTVIELLSGLVEVKPEVTVEVS